MVTALASLVFAAAISVIATPKVAQMARRAGVIDKPRPRGLHDRAVPRLGGIAILAGVLVPTLTFGDWNQQTLGIIVGAALVVVVGSLDDAFNLPPLAKLSGQVGASLVTVLSGIRVEHVTPPFLGGSVDLGPVLGGTLTLIGIVAVINAVNFTDGVDGLAAGVCTIAAITFLVIALSLGRQSAAVLAAATAGAAIGFLRHNFHPASVFMGDSGSNLLGFLLACVAIQGLLKTTAVVTFVFPLVILAVPILDTGFVVVKRIKHRRPVYEADRWHFHHRLTNIGFSQRRTVLYLYGWTMILAVLALALRFLPYSDHHGHFYGAWMLVLGAFALVALATSVYLIYVLEILKFRRSRVRQLSADPELRAQGTQAIDAHVARDVETGRLETSN